MKQPLYQKKYNKKENKFQKRLDLIYGNKNLANSLKENVVFVIKA